MSSDLSKSTTEPKGSPLATPNPKSLESLFEAHPDDLTDEDIDRMVVELRAQRTHVKQAKQAKIKSAPIPVGSIDEILAQIGLDKPLGRK